MLLDLVIADDLRTGLRPGGMRETERRTGSCGPRSGAIRRTVIGGSDAGAHLDMMCGAIYATALLAHGVREFEVVSLEEAVQQLTDVPASLYGLVDRGRITAGWHADLLFDPATVGYGPERTRHDLPGGACRLYAESTGMTSVLVGGVAVVKDGSLTGATPGTLLRSGRDTPTVPAGSR